MKTKTYRKLNFSTKKIEIYCLSYSRYVNAHATSTPNGDSVEAEAVRQVFPEQNIAVSSVKGHIGHLLGAAGSVEAIATIFAMNDDVLPANRNLEETDVWLLYHPDAKNTVHGLETIFCKIRS